MLFVAGQADYSDYREHPHETQNLEECTKSSRL